MIEVRMSLWRSDERSNARSSFYFENPNTYEGIMLRVPRGRELAESEVIAVTFLADRSGAARNFMEFLLDRVRSAPGGRVSVGIIWQAWSELHGGGDDAEEIAGVSRRDVPILFRAVFDAGPQGRGRLEGRVQRVWHDFQLHAH